jgi:hypothetical protein
MVAATQNGAWNVGINGTPNVKVSNPVTAVGITGTPSVQVANPATAPALTLDISRSASQHVALSCVYAVCYELGIPTPYVVPAGQNLVVTSVDIVGSGGNVYTILSISSNSAPSSLGGQWIIPNDSYTHSFQYPSGIVYPAGFVFNTPNVFAAYLLSASLQGYLTPI